jgi:hypothetical protein
MLKQDCQDRTASQESDDSHDRRDRQNEIVKVGQPEQHSRSGTGGEAEQNETGR